MARRIAAAKGAFVSVSLDGADTATHEWVRGVAGSFAAAAAGVRHMAEAGLHPQGIAMHLLLGRRVIGRRLPGQPDWQIRLPFRLLFSAAHLASMTRTEYGSPSQLTP
jgi:hypothetical protein